MLIRPSSTSTNSRPTTALHRSFSGALWRRTATPQSAHGQLNASAQKADPDTDTCQALYACIRALARVRRVMQDVQALQGDAAILQELQSLEVRLCVTALTDHVNVIISPVRMVSWTCNPSSFVYAVRLLKPTVSASATCRLYHRHDVCRTTTESCWWRQMVLQHGTLRTWLRLMCLQHQLSPPTERLRTSKLRPRPSG